MAVQRLQKSSMNALLQETTVSHDDLQDALSGVVRTCVNGTVRYQNQDGQYHRTNGPAVIWPDGLQAWYRNGLLHREDGPALANVHVCYWYLDGQVVSEKEFYSLRAKQHES